MVPGKLPKLEFLPSARVGIVLQGGTPVNGTILADIDERTPTNWVTTTTPPINVKANTTPDEDPQFILVQLLVAAVFGTLTFPIGSIVAVNLGEILVIGPSPV